MKGPKRITNKLYLKYQGIFKISRESEKEILMSPFGIDETLKEPLLKRLLRVYQTRKFIKRTRKNNQCQKVFLDCGLNT